MCCAEPIWRSTAGRVETFQLDPSDDDGKIREDAAWLGDMIRLWLNEEWSELEIHRRIGWGAEGGLAPAARVRHWALTDCLSTPAPCLRKEVARVFANARLEGCHEIQDVLVALTTELQAFDFYDSFTDAFSVSNKCVELLMMRAGIDCGCSTEADRRGRGGAGLAWASSGRGWHGRAVAGAVLTHRLR